MALELRSAPRYSLWPTPDESGAAVKSLVGWAVLYADDSDIEFVIERELAPGVYLANDVAADAYTVITYRSLVGCILLSSLEVAQARLDEHEQIRARAGCAV